MKMSHQTVLIGMTALLVFACASPELGAAPVMVDVSETSSGNVTTYSYNVFNATEQPVVSVRIGFDAANETSELQTIPIDWTPQGGLPPSSTSEPFGWMSRLVTTEESDLFEIEWSSDEGPQWDLAPGESATFSIKLPVPAEEYRTATFDALLGNGQHATGSVRVALGITLTPAVIWPSNGRMIPVEATVSVGDTLVDPEVRLVSITANEPLEPGDVEEAEIGADDRNFLLRARRSGESADGRIYAVTYSVTDAGGNVAMATAEVMVPHDQRR